MSFTRPLRRDLPGWPESAKSESLKSDDDDTNGQPSSGPCLSGVCATCFGSRGGCVCSRDGRVS